MAVVTNSYDSYEAVGNWTDIEDVIYTISPTETPFLSTCKKGKALNRVHQWQKDALATAVGTNYAAEGTTYAADALTATTLLNNVCGISDKSPQVTGSQEAIKHYGRGSEMSYQVKKAMKELKRDVETNLLQNVAKVTGDGTGTARKIAGFQTWIVTNQSIAGDATPATGDGSDIHTDGTARALTEAMFESVLASQWTSGGNPTKGYLNAFQKRKTATFSGNSTPYHDKASKKVYNSVDVYIDPLGNEVRLIPNRFVPTDVVYFVDPEYVKFATLRDFRVLDIPRQGDYMGKLLLVEGTLAVGNEAAHGVVADLSTS